jgi:hypothetical protein
MSGKVAARTIERGEVERVAAPIRSDLALKLRVHCARQNVTLGVVIERALERYLKENAEGS